MNQYLPLLRRYLLLRKRIREDIFFLSYLLGYTLISNLKFKDHHQSALNTIKDHRFYVIELPRGTFKTTLFTITLTIQDILNDPNLTTLICHFAGQNARGMLDELQNHFITNNNLRFLYPDICPTNIKRPETNDWTKESITVNRSIHKQVSTVEALGSDQAMASKHFDRIKFDDLVIEQSTATIDQINKATSFLLKSYSLLNIHDPTSSLGIIGTEWVPDDTMVQIKNGKILAPDGKPFKVFRVPAEVTDPRTNTRIALFPEILSITILDGLRVSQRIQYHAFYLLNAEEFEDQVWSKKLINWYSEIPNNLIFKIIGSVDPSISETDIKNNCETAVSIIGLDQFNELWLLDYKLGHGVDVIYGWFFELYDKWSAMYRVVRPDSINSIRELIGKFRFFSVETTLFQKLIAKQLRKEMSEKNKWIPIRECRPVQDKIKRISATLDPLLQNKAFHIKVGMSEAETQITRFGRPGQKNDLLDAISQGYNELTLTTKAARDKKAKPEDDYETMWANANIV